ncbi:hypothetical protein C8R46DRAFT_1237043 [Mycena filopes]|nr:hypothetical protein C8R46DRAFT_1237043 [Mycena filopes]
MSVLPLPAELEREIFETVATRAPSSIPSLLRKSADTPSRVEPLLYRVVSVTSTHPIVPAILNSDKPPEFFQHAVRHLAFPFPQDDVLSAPAIVRLLELCTGIVNFGCMEMRTNGDLLRFLEKTHVQRLALFVTHIFGNSPVDFTHPAFGSLTHLDMFEGIKNNFLLLLSLVPTLPVLTHLAVDPDIPRVHILPVLAECPRLQLLLVMWPVWQRGTYAAAKTASILDPRFVIGTFEHYWTEWEAGARGLPDFWSRGDDFVARKRKGEIEDQLDATGWSRRGIGAACSKYLYILAVNHNPHSIFDASSAASPCASFCITPYWAIDSWKPQTIPSPLSVLSHIPLTVGCACSPVVIPVHVDVFVPKDPQDPFGGLKSNASQLRRVEETYQIYGTFCEPNTPASAQKDVLQLLVHGFTYTSQYWSPPVEEFRNYSYAAFSCERGLASLAVDVLGSGLSSRPVNASDVQYPTASAALSQMARRLKTPVPILPGAPANFKTIIGVGHSAGSDLLNFGAIVEGARSPFDGLILTSSLSATAGNVTTVLPLMSARDVDPLRWGDLDPAYVALSNRTIFYPADPRTFSPRMVLLDQFTSDVGALAQTKTTALETGFVGTVAKVVGSEDRFFCAGTGRCDDVAALTAQEKTFWPAAKSFEVVVEEGSGHDMNLDFFARGPFNTFVRLVEQFSDS